MRPRTRIGLLCLALASATALTYVGSLDGEFVSDDFVMVRDNPSIRSLAPADVKLIFSGFDGANYIPLTLLSLAVDRWLWGAGPAGFHATNLLLHILCALLLYRILVRLELGENPAWFVAALWALHPVQVESVAWISERKNVLSTVLLFAAFRLYLSYSRHGRLPAYAGVLGLYALAMLSKMTAMVLPALCLAYELSFRFRLRRRDLIAAAPMLALAGIVAAYNLVDNPVHGGPYHGGSLRVTALSSSVVVLRYLGHVFAPVHLAVNYDVQLYGSIFAPPVLASLGLLAAIAAATVWCWIRRRKEGYWVLWFFVALSPMLNLVPFRSLMQDRYLYVPLVGPLVLLVLAAEATARRGTPRWVMPLLAATVLLAAGLTSVVRVRAFDDPLAFWADWALKIVYLPSERIWRPPELPDQIRLLEQAVARNPGSAIAQANLASLSYESDRIEAAIGGYLEALELDPGHRLIRANYGRALARAGRLDEADAELSRAAQLDPYGFTTWKHLTRVRLMRRDLDGAREAMVGLERIAPEASRGGRRWLELRKHLATLERAKARRGR